MGLSAAATDAAVAAVFILLWRLDRQTHLFCFGLSFVGIALSLLCSSLGHVTGATDLAEPFADAFYIGSLALLASGCRTLLRRAVSWRLVAGAAVGFFLIVQVAAQFGLPGVAYVPPLSGALYAWLATLFFSRRTERRNLLLGLLFGARAAINAAWPPFYLAGLAGVVVSVDQVIIVATALVLIVTDLTRARQQAEAATAELSQQTQALTTLNAQLAQERAQADTANRAKSQFLANISHELRTPLNAVIGFSDVLTHNRIGDSASKSAEYGRLINIAGQHLLGVINDILDMSRIEAGKVTMTPRPLDLRSVVQSVTALTGHQAEARAVTFHCTIDDAAADLEGDEQLLKQVLINLLSNAFKYTEAGGVVRLSATAETNEQIKIMVSDTGIGISAQDLTQIFEPFVFSGSALTRRRGGVGLGLSITKRLVELHGGTIQIASEVEKGSTVTVVLPKRQASDAAGAKPRLTKVSAA